MRNRDDEDDDDRPRKKKKKSGNLYLKIGLAVGGLLVVGGLIWLGIWLFGGGSEYDAELMAYMPADSNFVGSINVDDLNSNSKLKDALTKASKKSGGDPFKELNDKLKPTELTSDDFSRIAFGGTMDKGILVFRTKKTFNKAKMAEAMDCKKEQKQGDKTYYSNGADDVVYFPSDTLIVRTGKKHFESLASKNDSKVAISEEMQEIAKKMAKGQFWVAGSKSLLPANMLKGADQIKSVRIPYFPPEMVDALIDMKSGGIWLKADGDTIKFGIGILCSQKEVAEKAETELKKDIDARRNKGLDEEPLFKGNPMFEGKSDIKNFYSSLQKSMAADRNGNLVEMSASFTIGEAESLTSLAQPFMGGPPQPPINEPSISPKINPKKKGK